MKVPPIGDGVWPEFKFSIFGHKASSVLMLWSFRKIFARTSWWMLIDLTASFPPVYVSWS